MGKRTSSSSSSSSSWGIGPHLSPPILSPDRSARANETRRRGVRRKKPRIPVLRFRPKAARNAAAVGGSGPLTRAVSSRANSLGLCSLPRGPAPCCLQGLALVASQRWEQRPQLSGALLEHGARAGNAEARGGGTSSMDPLAWLLVLPGHRILCGRSRCATGWRSCCQAEITNGFRDCAHRLRLGDAIQGSALVGVWVTEADCTLDLDTRGHVPDLRCSLQLAIRR